MAAPLIHVDGALTICARAHSLNTAVPTLASRLAGLERPTEKSGHPLSGSGTFARSDLACGE